MIFLVSQPHQNHITMQLSMFKSVELPPINHLNNLLFLYTNYQSIWDTQSQ
jgi:hypothetical protein